MLQFVENVNQIIENIKTLENYLNSEVAEERQFAVDLVKKGRSMVIYRVNGHNHFAPVRFTGYKGNTRPAHLDNEKKNARDTAPAIQTLLGKPFSHDAIEKEFQDYAAGFKGNTLKSKRKYWRVRNDENKYFELITAPAEIEEADREQE